MFYNNFSLFFKVMNGAGLVCGSGESDSAEQGNKFYYFYATSETEKESKYAGNKQLYIPKLNNGRVSTG